MAEIAAQAEAEKPLFAHKPFVGKHYNDSRKDSNDIIWKTDLISTLIVFMQQALV